MLLKIARVMFILQSIVLAFFLEKFMQGEDNHQR